MTPPKLSLFFGAGAEVGYGLPSGGQFALDIFKISNEEDRENFREQIKSIDKRSQIANNWLPEDYKSKRINVFGKGDFTSLIESSLENERMNISHYLDNFDEKVTAILNEWTLNEAEINQCFFNATNEALGSNTYGQVIKLNEKLATSVPLFNSIYFSAFLFLLEKDTSNNQLKKIVRAFLELLIGAKGQALVSQLNEEIFTDAPDQLNVFDDLTGIFSLNYANVGQTGMEIVIEESPANIDNNSDPIIIFQELGRKILENIYSEAMDYQALIDSHFRYLYNPGISWAKFCRISIFLHTVRRYIIDYLKADNDKIENGPGYYHDLLDLQNSFDIKSIGTTNYNNFVKKILDSTSLNDVPIHHLNGSTEEYYDPYKNEIINNPTEEQKKNKILVPFIFTQSGVKPLTSIKMSQKYVELYDKFSKSDIICTIGYAFNGDDGHINGLFRNLVENEQKTLVIIHYKTDNKTSLQLKNEYQKKLRLDSSTNIDIIQVDEKRKSDDIIWHEKIKDIFPVSS